MHVPLFRETEAGLCDRRSGLAVGAEAAAQFAGLRSYLFGATYPCVGARAAIQRHALCAGIYPALGTAESAAALWRDLVLFAGDLQRADHPFLSFAAIFPDSAPASELDFERMLWQQLQAVHDRDVLDYRWDSAVGNDAGAPGFAFSAAGLGWFIVGLNPTAERAARRYAVPVMVFNAQSQFQALRAAGRYAPFQTVIRSRDTAYSGSINPNLDDLGLESDARQYAGRRVEAAWQCPFVRREADAPGPADPGPNTFLTT